MTVNITCEESGNWTEIDPEIFFCRIREMFGNFVKKVL